MNYKIKTTSKGNLKYRLPDCAEGFEYLSIMENIKTNGDALRIKGKIITLMEELIDYSELGYANYKELLQDKEEMSQHLIDIADEIFDDVLGMLKKKN